MLLGCESQMCTATHVRHGTCNPLCPPTSAPPRPTSPGICSSDISRPRVSQRVALEITVLALARMYCGIAGWSRAV